MDLVQQASFGRVALGCTSAHLFNIYDVAKCYRTRPVTHYSTLGTCGRA